VVFETGNKKQSRDNLSPVGYILILKFFLSLCTRPNPWAII